jgi:hypothetical protein
MVPLRQGRSLRRWVPSSVGSASQTATSTAKAENHKTKRLFPSGVAAERQGGPDRCRSSIRYTQSGAALAGFTVAVSHHSKTNGEWQAVTDGCLM